MYRFLVIIERADGNFSAYAPDLPGCVATGVTQEETERNIHEAIQLHIEGLQEIAAGTRHHQDEAVAADAEMPVA